MPIPDYQSLMLPVLQIAAEGETKVAIVADIIADDLGMTPEERETMLPSGKQRLLHNRIHWAKFYMSKAGLIDTPKRGFFIASDSGRKLLASSPQRIDNETLKNIPEFLAFYRSNGSHTPTNENLLTKAATDADTTPEEQVDAAQAVLNKILRADILERILANTPTFFERVIVDLLVGMGYGGSHENAALRLGRSGDSGIDGVVDEDRLGLDRIYVQAKRYASHITVQRPDIQAFVGSLVGYGATKGVFVTTSKFSSGAKDYANQIPQRVILLDGNRLTELMIEHDVGVRTSRTISLKRLDDNFFAEE